MARAAPNSCCNIIYDRSESRCVGAAFYDLGGDVINLATSTPVNLPAEF
jgi:hypothetical protein